MCVRGNVSPRLFSFDDGSEILEPVQAARRLRDPLIALQLFAISMQDDQ